MRIDALFNGSYEVRDVMLTMPQGSALSGRGMLWQNVANLPHF
jgi:hypothetical protein